MKEKNGIDPVIRKQKPDQKEQAELRILSPDLHDIESEAWGAWSEIIPPFEGGVNFLYSLSS